MTATPALLPDLRTTLVVAMEVEGGLGHCRRRSGLQGTRGEQRLKPRADALLAAIARLRRRAANKRVILCHRRSNSLRALG